jgi:hypothetical protein
MTTIGKIDTGIREDITTMITSYRHTPNRNNLYYCLNDNGELFFVDESLMLSLPFYIIAEQKIYDMVDTNGHLTGERFYRYEAIASCKLEERELVAVNSNTIEWNNTLSEVESL